MDKFFEEVFPSLQLDNNLYKILNEAKITRVASNPTHTAIRLYLNLNTLIPKHVIWKLEKELSKQIFPQNDVNIYIIEKFELSEQYTPENLFEAYKDSIYEEINAKSALMLGVLKKADFNFVDDKHLIITVEDNVITKEYAKELYEYLDAVFCERCGQKIIIDFDYKPEGEFKYKESTEAKLQNRISEITKRFEENVANKEQSKEAGDGNDSQAADESKKTVKKQDVKKAEGNDKNKKFNNSFGNGGFRRTRSVRQSDNPDVIYGRDFEGDPMKLEDVQGEMGLVIVRGKIVGFDTREIRGERTIISFTIFDGTDSLTCKIFASNDNVEELSGKLGKGKFIKVKGNVSMDIFEKDVTMGHVDSIMSIPDFTTKRMDNAPLKRVELHCHTKMSDMDAVSDAGDIVQCAVDWGHQAIAITDHGSVQAFPTADHKFHDIAFAKNKAGEPFDFKVIYGCEIYLVDDTKKIVTGKENRPLNDTYVVFDLETTGFNADKNNIIEIGAVKVVNGEIVDKFSEFVNPKEPIPYRITMLTSIRDEDVLDAETIDVILPRFMEFCKGSVMVAHNADFDMTFIQKNCERLGLECNYTYVDTVPISRYLLPHLSKFKLDNVAKAVKVSLENHHRAVDDAGCTAEIFVKFISMLHDRGIDDLQTLNDKAMPDDATIKKMPMYHCIVLAKNDIGRINLYRLVSMSNLDYFSRKPRVPKSKLIDYREGLIIGSACEAGELYKAILGRRSMEEITRLVDFYDYLEIQPIGNNAFMLRGDDPLLESEEDLRNINREIVRLGEEFKKPVVATCDVHFLHPEDEIYRRIIQAGMGFDDADMQPPLYLHTTEEMLEEFSYLGSDKAMEVVVTNTNMIADMCEPIAPTRPDKCPPVIENSEEDLRRICYTRAHEMYGEELPPVVAERLKRELDSIIGNGYSVMYIIAQKLVWKSNEDGYLVGSRGSVGSSFAATMAGITEVNPLSAHYLCDNCHYVDFDSEEVKAFSGRAGCDMPDKNCPVCGKKLRKEGFDIPFETFLGFKGDKEPDIDLNFSGDYQSKAHKYTEVIFGEGQTFKAGTVGTLADKTAYGYIKKYYEERGIHKRNCEIDRIVGGCVGVRRSTGQHPGGIVVLPVGEEINTFTPVQHPADKAEGNIITTHFDYHSIDSNLLKLDILGHQDPTMIRMLEDLTGLDAVNDIPLDDPKVMSLFKDTSALGVTPEELMGTDMGTLGIPEFGTDFAMGMLRDAKPKEFTDLIRISGLSHGTDVWLNNAQTLIQEGKATISTAICTRDDIMTYLIHMGLDPAESFNIMEKTRKGIIAKGKCKEWPEWKQDMLDHGVPEWYTWSCEQIKYMFPKAHAAAYVMMAWRVAYCKVYYPLAYYAAFFSIRADNFSYELMCMGKQALEQHIIDYKRKDKLSAKEEGSLRDMKIVQEMYARGFEFMPMDLYKSDARYFKIVDGKLLPPFNSIDGMGDSAAETLAIAASQGKFLSKDDLKDRGKVSKTTIDLMSKLGILDGMSESNQLSLFDFA
ncbi:MAG: PolC-type DNA polymerase III [Lachnospiraceae bacterium]|nr:PolC-type DNA polymerase III [Lachnospiraceae bacterium]